MSNCRLPVLFCLNFNFFRTRFYPHSNLLQLRSQVTAHAHTFEDAVAKLTRALREHRIRGVSTNIAFLLNVLQHPAFRSGAVTTRFIEMYPDVLKARQEAQNRGEGRGYYFDVYVDSFLPNLTSRLLKYTKSYRCRSLPRHAFQLLLSDIRRETAAVLISHRRERPRPVPWGVRPTSDHRPPDDPETATAP